MPHLSPPQRLRKPGAPAACALSVVSPAGTATAAPGLALPAWPTCSTQDHACSPQLRSEAQRLPVEWGRATSALLLRPEVPEGTWAPARRSSPRAQGARCPGSRAPLPPAPAGHRPLFLPGTERTLTASATPQRSGAGKVAPDPGWGTDGGGGAPAKAGRRVESGASWPRVAGLGRRARAGPRRGRMGGQAGALGSPTPLTLLSSCVHLLLPSAPLSHPASLTFPLLPLLSAVATLPSFQ